MSSRRLSLGVALAAALAVATGCGPGQSYLRSGEYSGSTTDKKSVVVDVGNKVLLDGEEMRHQPSGTWKSVHIDGLTMRCHMTFGNTEMSCTIARLGQRETVELLKL